MNHLQSIDKDFRIAYQSDCNVLITGETGTGKTSLARQIHQLSARKMAPFVSVNLATLHEGILESELFGHEKGSFTGADYRRTGKLETAQSGTVFLDEIGELPLRLQGRLLDFLQSRIVSPVGSNREMKLDVRVIAATHKDLTSSIEKGHFRQDLFHRLRVVTITLSAVREKVDEFDSLVHSSLKEICECLGKSILRISPLVAERLEAYHWPGNIRELKNALEYAVLSSEGTEINLIDLPLWLLQNSNATIDRTVRDSAVLGIAEVPMTLDYQGTLERFEKEYFQRALSRNGGRINRTARQIGLNKTTLLRRMKAYGISSLPTMMSF